MFADLERQEVMAEWEAVMARSPKARMLLRPDRDLASRISCDSGLGTSLIAYRSAFPHDVQ